MLHVQNVGLLLLPIFEQYYPVSNRVNLSEIGLHILDKNWSYFIGVGRFRILGGAKV